METSGLSKSGMEQMQNFSEYTGKPILEEKSNEKDYRFVYIWYDDPEEKESGEKTADIFIKEGEKLGLKAFKIEVGGIYSDLDKDGNPKLDKYGKTYVRIINSNAFEMTYNKA